MSFNQGYIQIHRQIANWEWYTDLAVYKLFTHCLIKANHTQKNYRGTIVERGTFLTSYSTLSEETGLSVKNIRTAFEKLAKTKEVAKQSTTLGTKVSVLNYDLYQQQGQSNGKATAKQGQSNGKLSATTNNENNDKKDNIKLSFSEINNFEDLFQYWNNNKKSGKYKNKQSYTIAFNKLKKLTNENFIFAKEVIENSIINNYAGFSNGNQLFLKQSAGQSHSRSNQNNSMSLAEQALALEETNIKTVDAEIIGD